MIATPIGNLGDLSRRQVEIISKVSAIACEDTRRAGLLLRHIKENYKTQLNGRILNPTLISYYEQNEARRISQIINSLINGLDIGLISDAGTPTLSDPGFKLVRECIKENIPVVSVPGPSAILSALVVSGLPTDKFLFLGFLPKKPGHRLSLLQNVVRQNEYIKNTVIIFEAPHKLVSTLLEIKQVFGDIEIVLGRELTKIHEEVRREKVSQSITHFNQTTPKGEIVILFNLNV